MPEALRTERRENDNMVIAIVQDLNRNVTALRGELSAHISSEPQQIAEEVAKAIQLSMHRAFPNDDPEGHRIAHEADMERIRARAEFWKKMAFEISRYGLLGFLGWAVYALWVAFLQGPHK